MKATTMHAHTFEPALVGDPATLRAVRRAIEAEVDRLIDTLDAFDGDPDIESLCFEWDPIRGVLIGDDREAENEHDEDDGTGEEDDPGEDGADAELSLGAPECSDPAAIGAVYFDGAGQRFVRWERTQAAWAAGGSDDCESDPAEAGIGDSDGLYDAMGAVL